MYHFEEDDGTGAEKLDTKADSNEKTVEAEAKHFSPFLLLMAPQ